MSNLDRFIDEWQDARIRELQELVRTMPPYQPQPGDADYQTPEQVARLRAELAQFDPFDRRE